jgi:hypothetical protein
MLGAGEEVDEIAEEQVLQYFRFPCGLFAVYFKLRERKVKTFTRN